jgi:hypothetical protein
VSTERYVSSWSALALTGAIAMTAASGARAADPAPAQPSSQELLDKVNQLQAEVKQLKATVEKQQQAAPAADQGATSAALSRDAQTYDRFGLEPIHGLHATYSDGRFVIQDDAGLFSLHPWVQSQFRYEATYRDHFKKAGTSADEQNGFELRRVKFGLDGSIFTPNLTYRLQWQVDRTSGEFLLEGASGQYHLPNTPFYVIAGQFKDPLDHEQLLASRFLTASDRTLTNDLFTGSEGFVQGAGGGFDNGGPVRAQVVYTDGRLSLNTNFENYPTGANPSDYGVAGRVAVKFFGKWADYDFSTGAYGATEDFLVAGAGADYTEAGDTHAITHVIDVDYGAKSGFAFYGAYTGRAFNHEAIGSIGTIGATTGKAIGANGYDWSGRAQISYAINSRWEPYGQYEFIYLDKSDLPALAKNQIQVIRAGINYYLYGPVARITAEANYLPGGSPISDTGNGILATGAATKTAGFSQGGGNEFIFRVQFQLAL